MKKLCSKILTLIFLSGMAIGGCSHPAAPYIKKDTSTITPLKVVRYISPDIRRYSLGEGVAVFAGSAIILDPLIGMLVFSIYHDIKKVPDDQGVPDFGKLVMDKFVERAKNEILNWPVMNVEEKPIWEDLKDPANFILVIKADTLEIKDSKGLRFTTIAKMKDKEDNVIWEKGYKYSSEQFNHNINYEQLKLDNFKMLKEEMIFAADATVTDFIEHYKNPRPETEK
jgi:hypothetical protein